MERQKNSHSRPSVTPLRQLNRFFRDLFRDGTCAARLSRRRGSRPALEQLEARDVPSGYTPTGLEQEFLERLNDARANPTAYGQSIGVDLSSVAPSQPLAFNPGLIQSSRDHSLDMSNNNYFGHTGSDGSSPFQRMSADGFNWSGAAESIAAGQTSVEAALAALITDSGVPDLGHRDQLLSTGGSPYAGEDQTGVGVVMNGTGSYHDYYTIDSGYTSDTRPFITGVAYNDANNNGLYDNGEGMGNVTISIAGVGSTTTWSSGGYSFQLSPGTYTVTASGGGLSGPITRTITVGSTNYRLNFLASQAPPATPPSAPGGLAAQAVAPDQVRLTWGDVSNETGFTIERSLNGQTGWTQVSTNAAGNTLLTDGNLTPGTTYYYRVRAFDAAGFSGYSNVVSATTLAGTVSNAFADSFDGASLNPAWSTVGGSWSQSGGVLQQTSTANANPRKALVTGQSFSSDLQITARVRLDSWTPGANSVAGVSLNSGATTGLGYNLVFHQEAGGQPVVTFLDDYVAWGSSAPFAFTTGAWYWFKFREQGGVLYGKVWADGTAEPSAWTVQQAGWTNYASGAPGLDGGAASNGVAGNSTVSFDDVAVVNPDSGTAPATPTGVAVVANLPTEATVTWSEVGGETGYAIQRSPDNATWAQVGTTAPAVTSFADDTLAGGTTCFYRVLALGTAGNSAPSAAVSTTTPGAGNVLFSDGFNGTSLGSAWSTVGGSWSQSGGVLQQTSTANANPRKALVTGQSFASDVEITARVRLDSWTAGPNSLAGVSLNDGATTGLGYNLVFHENTAGQKVVQFLDDYVAWGNSVPFAFTTGTWYWFKLEEQGGVLYGKVWADGTAEPSGWTLQQTGWANYAAGAPGLNGGAGGGGGGNSTVSFDDATVVNPDFTGGPPGTPAVVAVVANLPTEATVTWSEVGGETGYAIQRSPDNATWAQVGATAAGVTSFDDDTLTAANTYYYRVIATNGSGSSAPSSSVSATTPAAGSVLFSDSFNGTSLGSAWSTVGGSWSQSGGVLQQTSTANANPRKALVTGQSFASDVEITARVRLDSWAPGPNSLAGVSLNDGAGTGLGYNLVFHENSAGQKVVQFLDDYVAWGNSVPFAFTTGTWYWFKFREQSGVLYGKVWADGTAEPSGWALQQAGWANYANGAPGLNGGAAGGGGGNSTVSFDDATVTNPDVVGTNAVVSAAAAIRDPVGPSSLSPASLATDPTGSGMSVPGNTASRSSGTHSGPSHRTLGIDFGKAGRHKEPGEVTSVDDCA